jgi:hypothetical protein
VGSLDTEALAPLVEQNAALSLAPGQLGGGSGCGRPVTGPSQPGPREAPTAGFGLIWPYPLSATPASCRSA